MFWIVGCGEGWGLVLGWSCLKNADISGLCGCFECGWKLIKKLWKVDILGKLYYIFTASEWQEYRSVKKEKFVRSC